MHLFTSKGLLSSLMATLLFLRLFWTALGNLSNSTAEQKQRLDASHCMQGFHIVLKTKQESKHWAQIHSDQPGFWKSKFSFSTNWC